jgi:hypothetical protein
VLLIHHEFEGGGIRYVLVFSIIVFFRGLFIYSPPPVHVYIRAFDPHMNTSAIHNSNYVRLI